MPHLIRAQVLGVVLEIEIAPSQFEALQSAHLALVAGGAIEEKFEILLSNYLDLEKRS